MNQYKQLDIDQLQELFSQFLIDSWSYSKVSTFSRNEKAFEMQYIFGVYSKKSATTVAGNAYHTALEYYFRSLKEGVSIDLVELELSAFQYINTFPANQWKLQKTTPTVDDCIQKAYSTVSALLKNFMGEINTYLEEIAEVLGVEVGGKAFITINGVDIPLPCGYKIDVVVRLKSGEVVIIDHKSKAVFTDEEEASLSIGEQAITYAKCYEEDFGITVDEVWFIENKYSKNKDNTQQLVPFKVKLDDNTRKLYEALLYEPLKRVIEAVRNPDYVYLINKFDKLTDMAELYDFWCRTQICEVEDFNVEESKKELVAQRLRKIRNASETMIPPSVIKKFKENASQFIQYDLSNKNMTQAEKIEHVLRSFGTIVRVAHEFNGYSSNSFLLEISAGVKVSSIFSKRLDLANALDVENVRISNQMKVYQGKSYLQIDFKKKREADLLFDPAYLVDRKIPLGKDNFGEVIYWDCDNHSTPHMLVCGATGSGKTIFLKNIVEYGLQGVFDNIVILDPKIKDFKQYKGAGKNLVVVNDIQEIESTMKKLVDFMNELIASGNETKTLVIFDEFADALANARSGKELNIYENVLEGFYATGRAKTKRVQTGEMKSLEDNLRILLQKGRSVGFRIVPATQRADTKIITGNAKANLPVQVCFKVPKEVDSRVVLDEPGAESLAGYGDGLIKSPEYGDTVRFQAFYKPVKEAAVA